MVKADLFSIFLTVFEIPEAESIKIFIFRGMQNYVIEYITFVKNFIVSNILRRQIHYCVKQIIGAYLFVLFCCQHQCCGRIMLCLRSPSVEYLIFQIIAVVIEIANTYYYMLEFQKE